MNTIVNVIITVLALSTVAVIIWAAASNKTMNESDCPHCKEKETDK